MKPKKDYYVVTGPGQFPDDMLRHDQAEIVGIGTMPLLKTSAYFIYGFCTLARWQSFMWAAFEARRYYPAGDSEKGPVLWKVNVQGHWEVFHYSKPARGVRTKAST